MALYFYFLVKDIVILKMRTVEEDVIWENNFVSSSIAIFFKLIESLKNYVNNIFKLFSKLLRMKMKINRLFT